MALSVQNKWGFVTGTVHVPPIDHPDYEAWDRCNVIVSSWILRAVSEQIAESILYIDFAKKIWDDLSNRFSRSDPHKISNLHDEINSLRQGTLSVTEYYTRCRGLWDEITTLRPQLICECHMKCSCGLDAPKCEYGLVAKIKREKENDNVIRFFKELNEEFSSIKSGVLVLDPMLPVHRVFTITLKLEKQINCSVVYHNDIVQANVVHTENQVQETLAAVNLGSNCDSRRRSGSNSNKGAKFTFYGMNEHTIEKCYKKHGYQLGWIPGFKSKGKQSGGQDEKFSDKCNNKFIWNNCWNCK